MRGDGETLWQASAPSPARCVPPPPLPSGRAPPPDAPQHLAPVRVCPKLCAAVQVRVVLDDHLLAHPILNGDGPHRPLQLHIRLVAVDPATTQARSSLAWARAVAQTGMAHLVMSVVQLLNSWRASDTTSPSTTSSATGLRLGLGQEARRLVALAVSQAAPLPPRPSRLSARCASTRRPTRADVHAGGVARASKKPLGRKM